MVNCVPSRVPTGYVTERTSSPPSSSENGSSTQAVLGAPEPVAAQSVLSSGKAVLSVELIEVEYEVTASREEGEVDDHAPPREKAEASWEAVAVLGMTRAVVIRVASEEDEGERRSTVEAGPKQGETCEDKGDFG